MCFDSALEGKKTEFISFKGGFHGRTAASLSLTYKPKIREPFMPLVPGIHHAEFNNIEDVARFMSDRTAGVFIEPVQGESGVRPASPEFMRELRRLCDKHNALLIADEVQCGLGRTGKLFAHENYDVTPDIMTLAKPLAGGLPIGAVLTTNKIAAAVTPGMHGTTFGGNALVCGVANTVLSKIMDPEFLANVQKRGKYLASGLSKLQDKFPDKVVDVRTPVGPGGLFAGFELAKPVGPVIKYALEKRVLLISGGDKCVASALKSGEDHNSNLVSCVFNTARSECARRLLSLRRTLMWCSRCSTTPSPRTWRKCCFLHCGALRTANKATKFETK